MREQTFADFYQAASKYRPCHDPTKVPNAHPFTSSARHQHSTLAGQPITNFESTTAVPQLVVSAHGIVLDLGPGSGNQLERFDASKIEHVYGVEPNTAFTKFFMERLKGTKLGVDGKYTLVPCGIEDSDVLAKFGIVEGSVDCVLSMQVMVS